MGFDCFDRLPAGVRCKIWEACLPDEEFGAVFSYRDWKWRAEPIQYPINNSAFSIPLVGDNGIANPQVQVLLPLVFVNQEARAAALRWARRHGIELAICRQGSTCERIVIRCWNAYKDVLYVGCEKWDEFWQQACHFDTKHLGSLWFLSSDSYYDRSYILGRCHSNQPAWVSKPNPSNRYISRLAIPSDILECDTDDLAALISCMPALHTLLVVFGKIPDGRECDSRFVQPRWELADVWETGNAKTIGEYAYTDRARAGFYKVRDLKMDDLEQRMKEMEFGLRKLLVRRDEQRNSHSDESPSAWRSSELLLKLKPVVLVEIGEMQ